MPSVSEILIFNYNIFKYKLICQFLFFVITSVFMSINFSNSKVRLYSHEDSQVDLYKNYPSFMFSELQK